MDELDVIRQFVWDRFTVEEMVILHAYQWIDKEWGSHRCSVCGRTEKQRIEAGWNCSEDC